MELIWKKSIRKQFPPGECDQRIVIGEKLENRICVPCYVGKEGDVFVLILIKTTKQPLWDRPILKSDWDLGCAVFKVRAD